MRILFGSALAVAALLGTSAPLPAAADGDKVDCSKTDMSFSASNFTITCTDFSDATINVNGEATGGRKTEQLLAVFGGTYLVAVDDRPQGSRIYIKRSGIEENVETYFDNTRVRDWTSGTSIAGFETGEFSGGPKDTPEMECIGFRRVVSQHLQGWGRIIVGVSCSEIGREHAYDALKALQAPGG